MTPRAIGMTPSLIYTFLVSLVVQHPGVVLGVISYGLLGLLNGVLPAKVVAGPVGTALHIVIDRLAPTTRADAPATFKWPILGASILRGFADAIDPPPPAPRSGQSGRSSLLVLFAIVGAFGVGTGATLVCCGPRPVPIDGGPAVTPSSWTDGARVALTTLAFAVPAAKAIVQATVADPGRTQVVRALDATAAAAARMDEALVAYERAGGDRCLAKSATAGVHAAIVVLAQTLADNGIALGTTLERIADALAAVVDILTPACAPDAALASSAGDASNARLRDIAAGARARGVILSRVLDDLHPLAVDAGAH